MCSYQSFKELPKLLDHSQKEGAALSAASGGDMQPGEEEKERRGQGSGKLELQESLPQRLVFRERQDELQFQQCGFPY